MEEDRYFLLSSYLGSVLQRQWVHPSLSLILSPLLTKSRVCWEHGRMNYKDTEPIMSAFLKIDLLTDFAALCLIDFIDWRYIHSWLVFSTQLVNCCPHIRRKYTCVLLPLYLLSDLPASPPFPN